MQRPTYRTHVVQRAYLKRFESAPGTIWRYDHKYSNWCQVSIKKRAAVVENFYPNHVEKWLATNIEDPAASGLGRIAETKGRLQIDEKLRCTMSYYLAVQLYRTPGAIERLWAPAVSIAVDKQKDKLGKDEVVDHVASLRDHAESDPEAAGFALPLMFNGEPFKGAVIEIAKSVYKMIWRVGLGPDHVRFVTTDDAIATRLLDDGRRCFLFPLSSRRILVGVSTSRLELAVDRPLEVREIPAHDARKYNSELVAGARRYVFASRKEEWAGKVRAKKRAL